MTVVICQNVRGEPQGEQIAMTRRQRRLSTVVARNANNSRPFLVSLHRKSDAYVPHDASVKLRKQWRDTLVGKDDIVLITYLPLGRGGGGGSSQGKQIGMAVGMLALAIAMPYAVGALGIAGSTIGALTLTGKLVAAGLTAGIAIGASYIMNRASKTKDKEADNKTYSVSGGGNLPRSGERIPRLYGRAWIEPDLTQPPYLNYTGDLGEEQELYQRMTLTLGYCTVETIKVGDAVMWTRGGGVQPAFSGAQVEIIEPGGTSNLVPSAVISSQSVTSQDLPRPDSPVPWTGPFPLTPVGKTAARVQLDYSLPQGVSSTFNNKDGSQTGPMAWGVEFQIAEIDEDDNVISPWAVLHANGEYQNTTKPIRQSHWVEVDQTKRFAVRARNTQDDEVPSNPRVTAVQNAVYWDGMRAWLNETVIRPHVTELAIRVRASKALGVTAFNSIKVEAVSRLPVWTGGGWAMQETRKAIDAFTDIMRGSVNGFVYGADCPDSDLDLARVLHYRNTLNTHDSFDGVIRGPMSVYEAAETVLGVIRAQPSRIGNAWSLVRDEARTMRKHVITRRQIVRGSSSSSFNLSLGDGSADVIVEYSPNADPGRRAEVRRFFGTQTLTPRRYQMAGVATYDHAYMLATWIAACAYYRRERRSVGVELEGRLLRRGDPALVDAWFMGDNARAAGVVSRSGYTLDLDTPVAIGADYYLYVRDRKNREFGPLRVTQGAADNQVVVNSSDVAVVSAFYVPSVPWSSLWQDDGDEMTSVLIGPLTEVAEQYLIQSVEPQGSHAVNIDAVLDSTGVWSALGEAPPPQPPVPGVEDILGPTVPVVPWVRADAFQTTTALNMNWAVGAARGGVRYVVEIAYGDWAAPEVVSDGPATSGTYAIRHVEDQDVYIRAYAVSGSGVVGPRVFNSFRTFKPIISNDVASILIQIADLQAQVRHDIEAIASLGEGTVRRALKDLSDRVEQLAADAMDANVNEAEERTLLAAKSGQNYAAISHERTVRADADEAVAQDVLTMGVRVGETEAGLVEERTVRASQTEALAQSITTLDTKVDDNQASATSQISAISTAQGAQATQIGVLQTTVGGHTATLTTYGTSIDGISVQWGVTGNIDGVTGGFVLTGIRRMDGAVAYTVGIRGDLVVDGTIYGTKLATVNIITASAQIGSLTVDNIHVKNGAITNVVAAQSGAYFAEVGIQLRPGSRAVVIATVNGSGGNLASWATPSQSIIIELDGVGSLAATNLNYFRDIGPTGLAQWYLLSSTLQAQWYSPSGGWHVFRVRAEHGINYGAQIVVMELSK